MYKTGFIGAGNMGGAIVTGMIKSSNFQPEDIAICDKIIRKEIASLGVKTASIKETVDSCDFIVLAVKPNMMYGVIEDIKKNCVIKDKVFISIAAGLKIADLSAALGTDKLIRVMPNLCLMAGEGMCVICKSDGISENELAYAESIFASSGKTAIIKEELIDSYTAINGSGPAYVFMFMEAMADAAVKYGIDRQTAYKLSAQTVLGSAAMLLETGLHPGTLKDMVCSPGGTTIEAVQALEDTGLRSSVMAAVDACVQKTKRL